jgi:hypothetical protein
MSLTLRIAARVAFLHNWPGAWPSRSAVELWSDVPITICSSGRRWRRSAGLGLCEWQPNTIVKALQHRSRRVASTTVGTDTQRVLLACSLVEHRATDKSGGFGGHEQQRRRCVVAACTGTSANVTRQRASRRTGAARSLHPRHTRSHPTYAARLLGWGGRSCKEPINLPKTPGAALPFSGALSPA